MTQNFAAKRKTSKANKNHKILLFQLKLTFLPKDITLPSKSTRKHLSKIKMCKLAMGETINHLPWKHTAALLPGTVHCKLPWRWPTHWALTSQRSDWSCCGEPWTRACVCKKIGVISAWEYFTQLNTHSNTCDWLTVLLGRFEMSN